MVWYGISGPNFVFLYVLSNSVFPVFCLELLVIAPMVTKPKKL